jgi:hypothetical protein
VLLSAVVFFTRHSWKQAKTTTPGPLLANLPDRHDYPVATLYHLHSPASETTVDTAVWHARIGIRYCGSLFSASWTDKSLAVVLWKMKGENVVVVEVLHQEKKRV